jgi:hypothetical protein
MANSHKNIHSVSVAECPVSAEICLEATNRNRLMGFIAAQLHPMQHLLRHAVNRGQQKMDITHITSL